MRHDVRKTNAHWDHCVNCNLYIAVYLQTNTCFAACHVVVAIFCALYYLTVFLFTHMHKYVHILVCGIVVSVDDSNRGRASAYKECDVCEHVLITLM